MDVIRHQMMTSFLNCKTSGFRPAIGGGLAGLVTWDQEDLGGDQFDAGNAHRKVMKRSNRYCGGNVRILRFAAPRLSW